MLKRKEQKPVYRSKTMFRLADTYASALVTRLSAEYVVLGVAPEHFLGELRSLSDLDYVIRDEDVNGDLVRGGRIVSDDKDKASAILFDSLIFWCDRKNEKLRAFTAYFFAAYFSKLADVTPDDDARKFAAENYNRLAEFDDCCEHELLRRIILGETERGDSVSPILFPLFDDPKHHYVIDPQIYHKTIQRIIARDVDDMVLLEDDLQSADFLLAFADALPFVGESYKREFTARLFALLGREGKTDRQRTGSRIGNVYPVI